MPATSRRAVIASSGAVLALAFSSWAAPAAAQGTETLPPEFIRQRYLAASPEDVGASCMAVDDLLRYASLIPTANNMSVDTSFFGHPVTIDKSNVDRYLKLLTERQGICSAVIEKRGYESFAGTYAARANRACADARTPAYLPNINELTEGAPPSPGTVETISQDGFHITMENRALTARNPDALRIHGVAIEKLMLLQDGLSPDFYFTATRSGRDIVIRPMTAVIRHSFEAYPAGIIRPDWAALGNCAITLSPRTAP
jgi:hypothetical protein